MGLRLLLLFGLSTALWAQSSDGALAGTVRDPSGAVIPGARLEALNVATGIVTRATTNPQGGYFFPSLTTGSYRLSALSDGFKTSIVERVRLDVGSRLSLDLTLEVATAGTQVEVVAVEAKLDMSQATATVGGVLDEKRILDLPLTSRNAIIFVPSQISRIEFLLISPSL